MDGHTAFNQVPTDRYLGSLQAFAITNNAVQNSFECMVFHVFGTDS